MTLYHNKYIQQEEDDPVAEHRHHRLKVHKHEIFLTFFAETETLWSQGPVTWVFWKSYSIRLRYSTFKHFRTCSASDEIISLYAQPAMKSFHCMLSQRWNAFRIWTARDEIHSAYAQNILNYVFEMGSHFLLCWACGKIGYSLAEHAWKLVTHWLSMHGNWLLFDWAYTEIGYSLAERM